MKRRFTGLASLTALAAIFLATPSFAQTNSAVAKSTGPFAYDITKEITISGIVSSVLSPAKGPLKPAAWTMAGPHLLVTTSSGTVDASLGRFALVGKEALSIAPGNQVQLTGIMKNLRNQPVFVARTLKTGNQTFVLRNKHGFSVSPQTRERLSEKGVQP